MPFARPRVADGTQHQLSTDVAAGRAQRLLIGHVGGIGQDDVEGHRGEGLGKDVKVEPVITASRGQVEIPSARPLEAVHGYRVMFDLKPTDDSTAPVNLRLYLRANGQPLTETWLYQWTPPDRRTL